MNAIFGDPGAFGSPAAFAAAGASCDVASPGAFTESARPLSGTGITVTFGLIGAADGAGDAGAGAAGSGPTRIGAAAAGIRTAGIETFGAAEAEPVVASAGVAETEIRGTAGVIGTLAASCCAISAFVAAVLSAPHTGQLTGAGVCPFTGSTSNLNFAPHGHRILISIQIDRPDQDGLPPARLWFMNRKQANNPDQIDKNYLSRAALSRAFHFLKSSSIGRSSPKALFTLSNSLLRKLRRSAMLIVSRSQTNSSSRGAAC
jgi:hypothetical protein